MRVRRETVAEQSVQLLREQILERRLLSGAAVTEEAMARDFGISRPTVREVLNTLTVEGLLTRSPTTRVLHVTKLGREKIQEIYQARRLLETGGVMAYADREDAALRPLVEATDKLVAAINAKDDRAVVKSDIACHVEVVALVGSTDLTDFYSRLLAKLQLAMADVARSDSYDLHALRDDHVHFVELLKARHIEEARRLVVERLVRAEEQLLARVTSQH
jgi:DNA-binding GntR family transcriptional regulator